MASLMSSMLGGMSPWGGVSTPQNSEGLGLPDGSAIFNLPSFQPAGTDFNYNGNITGTPGFNLSITRTASSDPVQNIINDYNNPLSGELTMTSQAPAAKPPIFQSAPGSGGGYNPYSSPLANIGNADMNPNYNSALADIGGLNNFLTQSNPGPMSLKSRLTGAQSGGLQPFTFL